MYYKLENWTINKRFFLICLCVFFCFILPASVFSYTLTLQDEILIESAENKIKNFLEKYPNLKQERFIELLEEYISKFQDERILQIGDRLLEYVEGLNQENSQVTILEGWNIFDIDLYLTKSELIESGEYISYVENKDKITALSEFFLFLDTQVTLEGYLYPDTYKIDAATFQTNTFVIQQLEAFETKVYNPLFKNTYTNSITESVINLASIVEKEEKNPQEKPVIAGILKKRVKEYWNIGADATTCYPYKLTSQQCKESVSKYINIRSDYNTRFIIGLPPSPIGNPSHETIEATLFDEKSSYYYYLHTPSTGDVYYAETNEEHNINKQKYLK